MPYKLYWKRINYPSEKDDWKRFEKIIQQLLLMYPMLKNGYIFGLHFRTQLKS